MEVRRGRLGDKCVGRNSWLSIQCNRGFVRSFQEANATPLWANEKDRNAVQTFRHNFPTVRSIHRPIEDLRVGNDKLEPVDVLTGGFPCQPFSVAGLKKGFKDDRGTLFLDIIRIIDEFGRQKPKILLLENVANFKTHDGGRTISRVQKEIQKAGYWFTDNDARVLNTATHTTIPQNRSRVFLVALNSDYFNRNKFEFPGPLPVGSRQKMESLSTAEGIQNRGTTSTKAHSIISHLLMRSNAMDLAAFINFGGIMFAKISPDSVLHSWQTWVKAVIINQ